MTETREPYKVEDPNLVEILTRVKQYFDGVDQLKNQDSGTADEQRCPLCQMWSEKGEWEERESLHKLLGKLGSGLDRIDEKLDKLLRGEWK